jgi:hypothetical protein
MRATEDPPKAVPGGISEWWVPAGAAMRFDVLIADLPVNVNAMLPAVGHALGKCWVGVITSIARQRRRRPDPLPDPAETEESTAVPGAVEGFHRADRFQVHSERWCSQTPVVTAPDRTGSRHLPAAASAAGRFLSSALIERACAAALG